MGVRAMKHAALLQEWSAIIAECRSSGMSGKGWCESQGIAIKKYYYWEKRFITEATQQCNIQTIRQTSLLRRVDPGVLSGDDVHDIGSGITICHGESVITLPAGSSAEDVANLVKALNRHV